MQVAVVHADQRRGELQRVVQFFAVVHFHQHRHAEAVRQSLERLHLFGGQRGGDQQDRIRAHRSRLVDLVFVHDEILAQHRQSTGCARLLQMIRAALKELLIGQHRQTGRAMFRIACGNRGGIKIFAQHALAWAGLLDLRDHGWLAGRDPGAYRTDEIPHRRGLLGFSAQLRQRLGRFCGSHLLRLYREYLAEYVGHC